MAYKTISIDVETYELLKSRKRRGESFSDVIRAGLRGGGTGRDQAAALRKDAASDKVIEALDRIVARRGESPARRADL